MGMWDGKLPCSVAVAVGGMLGCPLSRFRGTLSPPCRALAHPSQISAKSRQSLSGFVAGTGPQAVSLHENVPCPWGVPGMGGAGL